MIFKGIGVVWDIRKARPLVNFRHDETFETDDPVEIELLTKAHGVECVSTESRSIKTSLSKKDLVSKAKKRGITGADRMSKETLTERLEE